MMVTQHNMILCYIMSSHDNISMNITHSQKCIFIPWQFWFCSLELSWKKLHWLSESLMPHGTMGPQLRGSLNPSVPLCREEFQGGLKLETPVPRIVTKSITLNLKKKRKDNLTSATQKAFIWYVNPYDAVYVLRQ